MGEYGAGQPVTRFEDARLLTGGGDFLDDADEHGQLHGFMLRSPHAHAEILALDAGPARAAPGVAAVVAGRDYMDAGWGPVPHIGPAVRRRGGAPLIVPDYWPVAAGRVRVAGEGVAFVVAGTLAQAREAAEAIRVEYAPLPAVVGVVEALADGAPLVWDHIGDNEALVHEIGDREAADRAFASADRVVERRFVVSRVLANAIETRGCLAVFDRRSGRYALRAPIQHPWLARGVLARAIGVDETRIRVVAPDVGGSFGIKANVYGEYLAALLASRQTGRPVKWTSGREEGFLGDCHARDNVADAALALDRDGRFLGLRLRNRVNIGAYFSPIGAGPAVNNLGTLAGVYTTPAAHAEVAGVFTNSHPTGPYRGAGRPEAAYFIERIVDCAARDLGIDPLELRRRNMIPPEAMPYRTSLTFTYDSGAFERNMDEAAGLADREGFAARRAASRDAGKLRGLGFAYAIERAAPPGVETAEIRFDAAGGAVVLSGATQQGQGHATICTQLACDWLGLDPDRVRVVQGDTDALAYGFGAGGSRVSAMGTAALAMARDRILEKGAKIAAHLLEAAVDDVAFENGRFVVAGTDREVSLGDVAAAAFMPSSLPPGLEAGLSAHAAYTGATPTYPNGCHACEVEIDPETGAAEVLRYVVVDDFGTVLNPLLLEGQVHGGVAQGAGQILMENCVYDGDGQLLTASFLDYAMPRADDLCRIDVTEMAAPTVVNPLGVKGAGEAGAVGALPAVMNAVLDALAPLGVRDLDMPATPARVWTAIRAARSRRPGRCPVP